MNLPNRRQIALQLYTVRNELAQDPERTLQRIKDTGIGAVEIAPLPDGLGPDRLARLLRSQELDVISMHCDLPLGSRLNGVVDLAHEMRCQRVIWHGWPRESLFDNLDGIHLLAEQYNQAHDNARRNGLRLGLHNHWWEFEPVQGRFPYRVFLDKLHPEIFLELDTYWARTAGLDPAALLLELRDRVELLHLKDGSTKKGEPMRALGDGVMDFHKILRAASPKIEWLVIELDECDSDIWQAVRQSFTYLREFC